MIYRVILKVKYYDVYFDFETIEDAGEFAKTILIHEVDSEDIEMKSSVTIKVINKKESEEE